MRGRYRHLGFRNKLLEEGELIIPIYEYQCKTCKHKLEQIVFRTKERKPKCPECGGRARKLVSRPGLLITDTSFPYTGLHHRAIGKEPITGRKNWKERIDKAGLMELSPADIDNMD